jgi:hypothetical protein
MIEYAVLIHWVEQPSYWQGNWAAHEAEEPPNFDMDIKNKPVLYRPSKFHFKALDGIMVLIMPEEKKSATRRKPKRPKLFMFPPQIANGRLPLGFSCEILLGIQ